MTPWQQYLNRLIRHRNVNHHLCLQDEMQAIWPGPYTVWEYWEAQTGTFACFLKFENSQDELMFHLKYSHTECPGAGINP